MNSENCKKKVKFFTLGCKVNQYETQALREKFQTLGCEVTDEDADIYVINTCTVTKSADIKSKQAVQRAKKENPKAIIAVCGCLTELNKGYIENIGVDYVIPQDKKIILPEIVLSCEAVDVFNPDKKKESLSITHFFNHRAFIKIQDGCDNFCSFCKIPYLRGKPKSRERNEVINEIERVSLLHREVVLCGINLGLYGKDLNPKQSLRHLVNDILNIKDLGRLRLSSLEPFFVDKGLFSLMNNSKLCPHFHFPFQYGDDEVLKKMRKKESVGFYQDMVNQARKVNPEVAISCDIMVGFPYETDKSFDNAVSFLKKIKPMRMHVFTFSPRENTPFFGLKVDKGDSLKKRYSILKDLADEFSTEYKNKFLGKDLTMVCEQKNQGFISGYTENYIKVHIRQDIRLGEFCRVRIERIDQGEAFAKAYDAA